MLSCKPLGQGEQYPGSRLTRRNGLDPVQKTLVFKLSQIRLGYVCLHSLGGGGNDLIFLFTAKLIFMECHIVGGPCHPPHRCCLRCPIHNVGISLNFISTISPYLQSRPSHSGTLFPSVLALRLPSIPSLGGTCNYRKICSSQHSPLPILSDICTYEVRPTSSSAQLRVIYS